MRRVTLITPALADANNGNWQTARRWADALRGQVEATVALQWHGAPTDAMIALHARRSADSIAAFAATGRPVAVVLTGTDLYRDIHEDASARRSLELASALVVLNDRGADELPVHLRPRTRTIVQSAPARAALAPRRRTFDLALVGHLRDEKDPITAVRAVARLPANDPAGSGLRLLIAGGVRDAAVGAAVDAAAAADPRIVRLGPLPHARARALIRRSRALLLPSRMEGGANVLIEAVTGGTPVLASRIAGSVGLLGDDYPGWFAPGDDAALADAIRRIRAEPAFLDRLRAACEARAPAFAPGRERDAVRALVDDLLRLPASGVAAVPAPSPSPDAPAPSLPMASAAGCRTPERLNTPPGDPAR